MKPYYEHAGITIYHGDCREVLPTLDCVSLVAMDPPYGLGSTSSAKNNYASYVDTPDALDELVADVMPHVAMLADVVAVTPGQNNIGKYPKPTWILCWATPAGTGMCSWGFSCWQPILVYGKDPYLAAKKGARPDLIIHTESAPKNGHPCPKPIGLWMKVIDRVSHGCTGAVLDPFMGSGTTLRAAKDLGRKAIGIEIEEKYCEIAANRLSQEVLF